MRAGRNVHTRRGRAATALLGSLLAAGLFAAPTIGAPAHQHGSMQPAGTGVTISDAWAAATMPGAQVGAAYLRLANTGASPVTFVSATSPASTSVEIHTMSMDGGVMRMRPVSGGVTIQPGQTVNLEPGGMHLMLMGLRQPLADGSTITLNLSFTGAKAQSVQVPVRSRAASGHHHH